MSSTSAVVRILKSSEGFVSGEKIAEELGVSRASVWKSIKTLRNAGFDISASTNKGYQLVSIPDIPSAEVMLSLLNTSVFGRSIEYHPVISSTNDRAMELGSGGAACGAVITADRQTAGRARRGGVWASPSGKNLYLSIVVRPDVSLVRAEEVAGLALNALGLAAGRFFPDICFSQSDRGLFFHEKKLGGVLCEACGEIDIVHHMAVGIGLNVSHSKVDSQSTSLFLITGEMPSRAELTVAVLEEFEKHYLKWRNNE